TAGPWRALPAEGGWWWPTGGRGTSRGRDPATSARGAPPATRRVEEGPEQTTDTAGMEIEAPAVSLPTRAPATVVATRGRRARREAAGRHPTAARAAPDRGAETTGAVRAAVPARGTNRR